MKTVKNQISRRLTGDTSTISPSSDECQVGKSASDFQKGGAQ